MQHIRQNTLEQGGLWLLAGLLLTCTLAGSLCLTALSTMETAVIGLSSHIGYSDNWHRHLQRGEQLSVAWDRAMPRGYERIYLHQGGDIIGALPESEITREVRAALADNRPVSATITRVDALDPAGGLRVRMAIEPEQQRKAVAVQTLAAYLQ